MTTAAPTLGAQMAAAVDAIRRRTPFVPDVGMILGTGLGALGRSIAVEAEIPYAEIPGFPLSTVESHAGKLLLGTLAGRRVAALQGRFHRYEGYSLQQVTFPVRVLRALGARHSSCPVRWAACIPLWNLGDLALLSDHINLMGDSPLIGPNDDSLGPRFPDMSAPYDAALRATAHKAALELGLTLREGVYVAVTGPALETRAEYRMLRAMGADVVGMSTVPEVIVAVHGGMRVLGITVVTDKCLPDALEPADVATIIATAEVGRAAARGAADADPGEAGVTQFPAWPEQGANELELELLARWDSEQLFRQAQELTRDGKPFVFYEGPPTANGRPGIHHVFARSIKDLICRFRVMQGRQVTRIAGWDTHGLPVEIEVEKELKLNGKKAIEEYGVARFNAKARESVFRYQSDWEQLSNRTGYWLDYANPYVTCSNEYIESVWWLLQRLHQRDMLYRGHRVLPYCPRCGTVLSSHELALGYEEIQDKSIYVTFPLADGSGRELVVWTTTPWTLPSNVAVAVHPELEYGEYEHQGRVLIMATTRARAGHRRGAARAGRCRAPSWWGSATSARSTWCRCRPTGSTASWCPARSSPRTTAPAWCTWRRPSAPTTTPRARSTAWRWSARSRPTAPSTARPGPRSRASSSPPPRPTT